jgi:MSHA biogenesis protein MshQ
VATVTARSFAGGAATLYAGSWWRITNASLPGTQATRYSAAGAVALDVAALPNESTDPVIAASGAGVGTLTFSSTGGIAFQRVAPVSPFAAEIALSIDVIDADGVAYAANPAKFGDASAGNGIAFSAGKTMRFGRLRLQNSYGPVTVGQVVPLETQYWNGTSFVRNTDDSCTTLNREHVALSSYTLSLNACETAATPASVSFSGGQASLPIAAAGAGNTGRVLLTPILGSTSGQQYCPAKGGAEAAVTSASRAYLQARWTGVSWNEDPSARATFGLYGQARNFIFYRENY